MNQQPRNRSLLSQSEYLRALATTATERPGFLIVPLLAAGLIGTLVAFLGPKQWQATQTFVVREELIGRIVGPGRFESLDTMKTAQETIQEVARRPAVIERTLRTVGPASGSPGDHWPGDEDIESLQGAISFFAPNGAEFGKTEVLMMKIKATSRVRAEQITSALFKEMKIELRQVRHQRAASMQKEIVQAVEFATEQLDETSSELSRIEASVGADISELRSLVDPNSRSGELRQVYVEVQSELRSAKTNLEITEKLIEYLKIAQQDATHLIATPRELIERQPALDRLKVKLIDAQVAESTLRGKYSLAHPAIEAAAFAVSEIKRQIDEELTTAIEGLNSQLQIARQQVTTRTAEVDDVRQRLDQLVGMRVGYGQLVDELAQRKEDLKIAQQEFSRAESIRRAAEKVDLLTELGDPQASIYPIGPSKKTILAGALLAGLLIGIGSVMLVTPTVSLNPPPTPDDQAAVAPQPPPTQAPKSKPVSATTATGSVFVIPDINADTHVHTAQQQ